MHDTGFTRRSIRSSLNAMKSTYFVVAVVLEVAELGIVYSTERRLTGYSRSEIESP